MKLLTDQRVSTLSIHPNGRGKFDFSIHVDGRHVIGVDFETIHDAYEAILIRAFVEAPAKVLA